MFYKLKKAIYNPNMLYKYIKKNIFNRFYNLFLFDLVYGSKNEYVMNYQNLNVRFLTDDDYSKHWFFPRYDKGRIHEPVITKMIINSLTKEDVFLDIGTHLGYFTCVAGKVCTEGKVFGFEIDKQAYNISRKNIKYNNLSNVEMFNYAVSDKNGYEKVPNLSSPHGGLSMSNLDKNFSTAKSFLSVKAIKIDYFFEKKEDVPTVAKIDVEGAEMSVLKGMESLLTENEIILFLEIHGEKLPNFNTDSKEVISFLEKMGYNVYEIENHRSSNINDKGRLKKLNSKTSIDYNTMCYVTKRIKS